MLPSKTKTVIAIDGPAGAGKSTVARALARQLGYFYLDTGAMYRALTFKAIRKDIPLNDEPALVHLAEQTKIDLKDDKNAGSRVFLDGEDVSDAIRTTEVTNNTYFVARTPQIRKIMVQWQREFGQKENIVMEGRDIGTVVFPKARFKFYLDADFAERAKRRIMELQGQGKVVDESKLSSELQDRDQKDLTRKVGPLKKAPDAVFIDSTSLTIEQVVAKILQHVRDGQSENR
jgi:CMP/dCMP kinase